MNKGTKYIEYVGMAISLPITILFLQTFAEKPHEQILFFFVGVLIEACKMISLLVIIRSFKKNKMFSMLFSVFFVMYFFVSLTFSVSYAIYTDQKQTNVIVVEVDDDINYKHDSSIVYEQKSSIFWYAVILGIALNISGVVLVLVGDSSYRTNDHYVKPLTEREVLMQYFDLYPENEVGKGLTANEILKKYNSIKKPNEVNFSSVSWLGRKLVGWEVKYSTNRLNQKLYKVTHKDE